MMLQVNSFDKSNSVHNAKKLYFVRLIQIGCV